MSQSDSVWTVSAEEAGVRLDKFLAGADRLGSRSRATAAIERGKVFVNDDEASAADAARRLSTRDRVRVWMDRPGSSKRRPAPHQAGDLEILYEDDDLIAVDKPPGLLSVPLERMPDAESVFDQIDRHLRSHRARRPFTVHRIDRDTSGVVAFAKHAAALRRHLDTHHTSVARIATPPDQPDAFHLCGEPTDGRRAHLLGRSEVAQRLWSAHEHRKRGQLRRRRAGERIAASGAPQEMDRRGVQAIGEVTFPHSGRRPGCVPGHAVILVSKAK